MRKSNSCCWEATTRQTHWLVNNYICSYTESYILYFGLSESLQYIYVFGKNQSVLFRHICLSVRILLVRTPTILTNSFGSEYNFLICFFGDVSIDPTSSFFIHSASLCTELPDLECATNVFREPDAFTNHEVSMLMHTHWKKCFEPKGDYTEK